MLEHFAASASVATDNDSSPPYISPERLTERAGERRRQELTHDAADAGNSDLQQMFAGH
jgi:hypothetical protein